MNILNFLKQLAVGKQMKNARILVGAALLAVIAVLLFLFYPDIWEPITAVVVVIGVGLSFTLAVLMLLAVLLRWLFRVNEIVTHLKSQRQMQEEINIHLSESKILLAQIEKHLAERRKP